MSSEFSLRDYQVRALDIIDRDLKDEQNVLLQAATGAGKTVTVARLINAYWFQTDRRFLVLAHKSLLVKQFYDAFISKTNIPFLAIGICCAELKRYDTKQRLVIATIQTFVNRVEEFGLCDLLVIDECHRVEIGKGSQYDQVISKLRAVNPDMRLLGLTATPARLGHGYIYGDRHVPGGKNLFSRLNHQIKYDELLASGHLVALRGKVAHADSLDADLAGVSVNGDYVLDQLGDIMSKTLHLQTAVDAITEHCQGYKCVCVFCCTINHADRLAALLPQEDTTVVHSALTSMERFANLAAWKDGRKRICVSVNILVEGFDHPPLDCLVFARPTLSSSLYLQAIGRALRTSPGKDHAMLLDLTDNTARFGTDLDRIKVSIPKGVQAKIDKENSLFKLCPQCEKEVHRSLRVCDCGFAWPEREFEEAGSVPELAEVVFKRRPPEWHEVQEMTSCVYESRKKGTRLGKVTYDYGSSYLSNKVANIWLCFPDNYNGYAVVKSEEKWEKIAPDSVFPESVEQFEGMRRWALLCPEEILVDESGEYPEIIDFKFSTIAPPTPPQTFDALGDDVPF